MPGDPKKKSSPPKFYADALKSIRDYSHDRRRVRIITWFCAMVFGLVIVGGLAVMITWLALRPHKPRFYVDYGSVTEFNISPDESMLNTTMIFNITSRNPNERIGIYYHKIDAYAYYNVQSIASTSLPPFYQGPKDTTILQPALTGKSVFLEKDIAGDLSLEHTSGTIDLTVKLYAKIHFKVGTWKSGRYTMKVKCDLSVDVNGGFMDRKQCSVYF